MGVFAAIFDESGRILCVRANSGAKGWTTPGGRLEAGESPPDALRREVLEETGLEVAPGELIGVYSKPRQNDVVLFFRAEVLRRNEWRPNGEISELGYFSSGELPQPVSPAARARITDALEGQSGMFRVIEEASVDAINNAFDAMGAARHVLAVVSVGAVAGIAAWKLDKLVRGPSRSK
jgi:ADP-ribose pyrophosphatase YjhB (NUDIX family)